MSAYADDPEHFWRWLRREGWRRREDPRNLRAAPRLCRLSCRCARWLRQRRCATGDASLSGGMRLGRHDAGRRRCEARQRHQPDRPCRRACRRPRGAAVIGKDVAIRPGIGGGHAIDPGRRRAHPRHRPQHGRRLALARRSAAIAAARRAVAARPDLLDPPQGQADPAGFGRRAARHRSFLFRRAGSATWCARPNAAAATGATSSMASGRSTSASGEAGRPAPGDVSSSNARLVGRAPPPHAAGTARARRRTRLADGALELVAGKLVGAKRDGDGFAATSAGAAQRSNRDAARRPHLRLHRHQQRSRRPAPTRSCAR